MLARIKVKFMHSMRDHDQCEHSHSMGVHGVQPQLVDSGIQTTHYSCPGNSTCAVGVATHE